VTDPPPDRIEVAPEAVQDLAGLVDHLAEHNPRAALAWTHELNDALALLASYTPRLDGPPVRFRDGTEVRRWPVLPAVLFYQRLPRVLRIARIYHHRREPITRG